MKKTILSLLFTAILGAGATFAQQPSTGTASVKHHKSEVVAKDKADLKTDKKQVKADKKSSASKSKVAEDKKTVASAKKTVKKDKKAEKKATTK